MFLGTDRNVKKLIFFSALMMAVITVFCATQLPGLNLAVGIEQFLPKESPVVRLDRQILKRYQISSDPLFFANVELLPEQKGDWLSPGRMQDLQRIGDTLSRLKGVRSVLSVANLELPLTDNQSSEVRLGTLMETKNRKDWRTTVETQALLSPQFLSKDRRAALIAIEPGVKSLAKIERLEAALRTSLQKNGKGYSVGLTGTPVMQAHLSQKIRSDVGRFLLLSLLAFILLFALFYKNWVIPAMIGLGLSLVNIVCLGTLALFKIPFTSLMSTLPIIVSIAFVSLVIHTLGLWAEKLAQAENKSLGFAQRFKLGLKTLQELIIPNLLGSLTTSIGFATLATEAIPAIRSYALAVAGCTMLAWLMGQFGLALCLPYLRPQQRSWIAGDAKWMLLSLTYAKPIIVFTICLTVWCAWMGTNLNFSSRLFNDLPESDLAQKEMQEFDRIFGGTVNLEIEIDKGKKNAWTNAHSLDELKKTTALIRQVAGVGSALSVGDFLGQSQLKNKGQVAEAFFVYSMSPEDPLRQFLDKNLQRTRIAIRLADFETTKVESIRSEIRDIVASHFPSSSLTETGIAVLPHIINKDTSRDLVFGFWQSLLGIGLLMLAIFRSWRWAMLACLPNLVAPFALIGAMSYFHTPVRPAIALIFSIALGLAFNNTVYILSRYKQNMIKMTKLDALRSAVLQEGNACLSESIIMLIGFLVFLSSDFKLNQNFGAYMALSIIAGALGDLAFLPAMLLKVAEFASKKSTPTGKINIWNSLIGSMSKRWSAP